MNHQIGKTSLDIRASRKADGFALQSEVSDWFWQTLLPELSRALDAAVPADVVVRMARLDIEVPMSALTNWQDKLTPSVCRAIVEEVTRRRLFPRPTDAPIEEISVSENGFSAWLLFIESGQKPLAVGDFGAWQEATLAAVATSPIALARLINNLMAQPRSLERLIRQHDAVFLGQLSEAITGKSAAEIKVWQQIYETLLCTEGVKQMLALPPFDRRMIHFSFWQSLFEEMIKGAQAFDNQQVATLPFFVKMLQHLSNESLSRAVLKMRLVRFFQQKLNDTSFKTQNLIPKAQNTDSSSGTHEGAILETKAQTESASEAIQSESKKRQASNARDKHAQQRAFLQNAWTLMLKPLAEPERLEKLFAPLMETVFDEIEANTSMGVAAFEQIEGTNRLSEMAQSKAAQPAEKTQATTIQDDAQNDEQKANAKEPKTDTRAHEPHLAEGEHIYIGVAGLVLLHPFIVPFFEAVGLLQKGDFVDETARLRGVGLLQYLAVGDADMMEYDAALLKWVCGVAFDTPIDTRLDLTDLERKEAHELLETVIKYWGALGEVGIESLQVGFLQRDGKLSKRSEGWLLQIEKQTIDILLDRLPWGFGVIKMPWQTDMLFVEW